VTGVLLGSLSRRQWPTTPTLHDPHSHYTSRSVHYPLITPTAYCDDSVLNNNCNVWHRSRRAVPWMRLSIADHSYRRPGFDLRSVHVRFVVHKVALEQASVRVMLHTHVRLQSVVTRAGGRRQGSFGSRGILDKVCHSDFRWLNKASLNKQRGPPQLSAALRSVAYFYHHPTAAFRNQFAPYGTPCINHTVA
jgi:hypothetical protein